MITDSQFLSFRRFCSQAEPLVFLLRKSLRLLLATPPAKADTAETLALAIGAVLVELHLSQMKLAPGLTENLTWIKNKSFPNHFSSKVLVKTVFLLTSIKSDTPRLTTPSWISWSVVHQVRLPTYNCHLRKLR